jgi:biopolymer transport protein ExbD
MAEINMVPLIDVMLVLLLVFMITAPLLTHAIPVNLPRASNEPPAEVPARLAVAIDGRGQLHIDSRPVDRIELQAAFREAALRTPQPVLNLSADRDTRYETVAQVLADAARAGLSRVGFVTDPNSDPGAAARD